MELFKCGDCGQMKPRDLFPKGGKRSVRPHTYCRVCQSARNKDWAKRNPERAAELQRRYRARHATRLKPAGAARVRSARSHIRAEVLDAYGGPFCRHCGIDDAAVLTIDHIDNDGNKHRKREAGARHVFLWVKRNGFPPGFQVLCRNCNWLKHANGGVLPEKPKPEPFTFIA